ncbi:hypothetical protein CC78DRAFT_128189 [Lojkania enalia]|uniref:Uncharacterized protein n=1 Tax=Lojkania enalia TaxID=147567 RepID=A0A9P4JWG0_9PLEO|nr:hypothetical protein CC78DRAFT_128189 [Didymosphaeria enalia]
MEALNFYFVTNYEIILLYLIIAVCYVFSFWLLKLLALILSGAVCLSILAMVYAFALFSFVISWIAYQTLLLILIVVGLCTRKMKVL